MLYNRHFSDIIRTPSLIQLNRVYKLLCINNEHAVLKYVRAHITKRRKEKTRNTTMIIIINRFLKGLPLDIIKLGAIIKYPGRTP